MHNPNTLPGLIHRQAEAYGDRVALMHKGRGKHKWEEVSWRKFAETVSRVSNALMELGVGVQENLAVFSQNKPECLYVDFGAYAIRGVTIPFYATSSETQVKYMVSDARIRYIFVGEQYQYDTAYRILKIEHSVSRLIIFDRAVRKDAQDKVSLYFDEFLSLGDKSDHGEEIRVRLAELDQDDLANVLYTSGTTGLSKGVMITHRMYNAAIRAHKGVLNLSEKDVVMNFLPFTHIFEKGWAILALTEGSTLIINTDPREVQTSMKQRHPSCMSAVPRFWEKVYAGVTEKIDNAPALQQKLFRRALAVGRRHNIEYLSKGLRPPLTLQLEYKLMDKTVFALVRKQLGLENAHFFPTAGSFVSPEVEEFVHSIGIFMVVGYGLTESLATVSNDHLDKPYTIGSIGRPIDSIDIKFSEEGEILLKGPTITKGYYNRPDLNAVAFTEDGYFRTGDVGYMKDGELYITERIKDLFKTSNGKYIAPQMVESKILVDKYVEQVAVIADQRKFVSALIVPTYPLLEQYARDNGIPFANREELCRNSKINAMISDRIDTLQQTLANYEKIKRFTLMPHHFSLERGEVTNTLKIKRNVLNKNYADVIDAMYDD